MFSAVFERFAKESPICVMSRAVIDRVFSPDRLDQWFDVTARVQYTRELLFSTVFDMMAQVVCGVHPSVNAAYQKRLEAIPVSVASVYNKINGLEISTSAELVRFAANGAISIMEELGGTQDPLLPGYRVKILDGNCIEATEHRIHELRSLGSGALPGKSLVVLDPSLRIPIDVFPCEDGHAQERSLLDQVLPTVQARDVWIADRNFCTRSFLYGICERDGFFIIRQHGNLPWEQLGPEELRGKTSTGAVYEMPILVVDEFGKERQFRRIHVYLKKATRDGDKHLYLITNLPEESVPAAKIAELYRKRWKIETAFQELEKHLNSEINALGYPKAALFGFCVALVAYTVMAVVKAALSNVHGAKTVDESVSGYYLADEISGVHRGMLIAVPAADWRRIFHYSLAEFTEFLVELAHKVKLSAFRKHKRGPKKPSIKEKADPKKPHVSTAKIVAQRKK